jgi:hypothetical protein
MGFLGFAVVLFAGSTAGLVRYIGRGWPWYTSALVGFVLYWPGMLGLILLYSMLGVEANMAMQSGPTHSFFGVLVGGIIMSAPFSEPSKNNDSER